MGFSFKNVFHKWIWYTLWECFSKTHVIFPFWTMFSKVLRIFLFSIIILYRISISHWKITFPKINSWEFVLVENGSPKSHEIFIFKKIIYGIFIKMNPKIGFSSNNPQTKFFFLIKEVFKKILKKCILSIIHITWTYRLQIKPTNSPSLI